MGLCSLAIYASAVPFPLRYLACLISSAIEGVLPASLFSSVPIHAPKADLVATTSGLIMQGSQLGQVLGPPLLALTVSRLGGWQAAPLLPGVAAFLGIILSLGLAVLERPAP